MSDPFATPIFATASTPNTKNPSTPFTPPCPRNLFDASLHASPRDSHQKSDVVVKVAAQSVSGGEEEKRRRKGCVAYWLPSPRSSYS